MRPNAVSYRVIGSAIKVHNALGPGLFESAYHACLCHQFAADGLRFQHHVRLPLVYNGVKLAVAYQIDFVVENCLVVEIKCVEHPLPVHSAQLLSYLKLSGHKLGLLINFHVPYLRDGIERKINAPESEL